MRTQTVMARSSVIILSERIGVEGLQRSTRALAVTDMFITLVTAMASRVYLSQKSPNFVF